MKRTPLSLSDQQLRMIRAAAAALPVSARDEFLQNVTRHLTGEPSDDVVTQAIKVVLDRVPVFLTDSAPPPKKRSDTMRHHHHDDDDAFDENGIIKDGRSIHTPMFLMDSTQRSIALHDGHGRITGHRPGHIVARDANDANDARDKAYRLYDEQVSNAWRAGGGAEGPEGAQCTCRNGTFPEHFGAPGHIVDGVCTPDELLSEDELRDATPLRDGLSLDALEREHQQRVGRAYQQYDEELRNAWRTP
jgi:hypothetical protein